ncbi:hypothetical protein ABEY24_10180 [Peribacillus frigoritolerans]|uniref:hypothetical protein n=1 Tax=Peribacillus frigoritolerans TaxID=450367 RepID=UPI003D2DD17C
MELSKTVMCTYCGKHFDRKIMTPLYEKNKPVVNRYCEKCVPRVKVNILSLHWRENLWWENKGE